MPDPMTYEDGSTPSVKVLDDFLVGATISRIKTDSEFPGCSSRTCYNIDHTTKVVIPGGSRIRLQIRGTMNQNSVVNGSSFEVRV
jgi:hypothetical protein